MNNIFPIDVPLTIVWHLTKPDGTDFSLEGYSYRLFYKNGKGKAEADSTMVTASANAISFVFPTNAPRFAGEYSLQLLLFQNGSLFCTLNYNNAFGFTRLGVPGQSIQNQESTGRVVHLYTVAEYYLLAPVVPTVGSDGYWYVNGVKITDGSEEYIPSSHTVEYDSETKQIIIDRGRVDSHGESIEQTITDVADALTDWEERFSENEGSAAESVAGDGSRWGTFKAAEEVRAAAEGTPEDEAGADTRWGAEKARRAAETERLAAEGTPEDEAGADTRWGAEKARRAAETERLAAEGTSSDDPTSDTRWGAYKRSLAATTRANEAAAAAEHMVDIKRGPKGDQGNTGSSVDYPYELVNNRTTNDATKGLTAAMGKIQKDEHDELAEVVTGGVIPIDLSQLTKEYITIDGTSNKWQTSPAYYGCFVPIVPGGKYRFVAGDNAGYYTVLRDNVYSQNALPNYAAGYSSRVSITSTEFVAPNDAAYVYILLKNSTGLVDSLFYSLNGLTYKTGNMQAELDAHEAQLLCNENDLSELEAYNGVLTSGGNWSSSGGKCVFLPITPGKKYKVVSPYGSIVAVLAQSGKGDTGEEAVWATGFVGRIQLNADDVLYFTAPNDALSLYMLKTNSSNENKLPVVYTNLPDFVSRNDNEHAEIGEEINDIGDKLGDVQKEYLPIDFSGLTQYQAAVNNIGKWVIYSGNEKDRIVLLPITPGESYKVTAKEEIGVLISVLAQSAPGTNASAVSFATGYSERIAVEAGTSYTFTAPSDAVSLGLQIVNHSGGKGLQGAYVYRYHSIVEQVDEIDETLSPIPSAVSALEDAVGDIPDGETRISLSELTQYKTIVRDNGKWLQQSDSARDRTVLLPIVPGKTYTIIANETGGIVAILKEATPGSSGSDVQFATGYTERTVIDGGESFEFVAPGDAVSLYVLLKNHSGEDKTPQSVTFYGTKSVASYIGDFRSDIDELKNAKPTTDASTKKATMNLLQSIGNPETPLAISLDENGYEVPQTRQSLIAAKKGRQLSDVQWTTQGHIELNGGSREAGVTLTGVPYSSVKELAKFVGQEVTLYTFMTAVNNPYSLLYTEVVNAENSQSAWGKTYHGSNCACYYGSVCSRFADFVNGMQVPPDTGTILWLHEHEHVLAKVFDNSSQGCKIGDIYLKSGHNRVITGLKRNAQGEVTHVEVSEALSPTVRRRLKTAQEFDEQLASEHGVLFRNIELYKNNDYEPSPFIAAWSDEAVTPYEYNDDICCFAGDKACFREGDTIAVNYNLKQVGTWTHMQVYKGDTLIDTIALDTSVHVVDLTSANLTYGKYKARLTDGTYYSDYTEWEIVQTNVSVDFPLAGKKLKISFASNNGTPLYFNITEIGGGCYAYREFTKEEIAAGEVVFDLIELLEEQKGYSEESVQWPLFVRVYFVGEYGRVINEPIELSEE